MTSESFEPPWDKHHINRMWHHYHTVMTLILIIDSCPHYIRSPWIVRGKPPFPPVPPWNPYSCSPLNLSIPCGTQTTKRIQFAPHCFRAGILSKAHLSFQGCLRTVVIRSNLFPTGQVTWKKAEGGSWKLSSHSWQPSYRAPGAVPSAPALSTTLQFSCQPL